MTQVQFNCPSCGFNKQIFQKEIPTAAKKCTCPKCKKTSNLIDAITSLRSSASTDNSPQNNKYSIIKTPAPMQQVSPAKMGENTNKYNELFDKALSYLYEDKVFEAMILLEDAEKLHCTPKLRTYLAYCHAMVRHEFSKSIGVCKEVIREQPATAEHYLNLGRIYMLVDKRGPAMQVFRKGIKIGSTDPKLMQELRKFEPRKPPVFSSLPRGHFLNLRLGKALSVLRLR